MVHDITSLKAATIDFMFVGKDGKEGKSGGVNVTSLSIRTTPTVAICKIPIP